MHESQHLNKLYKNLPSGEHYPLYIDGKWLSCDNHFPVNNPSSGEVIGMVADAQSKETIAAIDAAAKAFPAWSKRPCGERSSLLLQARDLLLANKENLAKIIALEEGKVIQEARGEIFYAAEFLRFFAEAARQDIGEVIASHVSNKRLFTLRQPVGVCAIISIWNFPIAGVLRPLAAALAAGCTAVLKPPEQTPLSAIAVFEILEEAGFPPGVANLVTTNQPKVVGQEFFQSPTVRKVSFTGSTAVGKEIIRGSAEQVQRVSLELGGHAPLVVFEDADIEAAVNGALNSKFRNNGQICIAVNRIYVANKIADQFTKSLVSKVEALKVGSALDDESNVGPLIDQEGLNKVKAHVADAVEKGAKILCGGSVMEGENYTSGLFFAPTVLSSVTKDMKIMQEETFGPVVPIVTFQTEEEVLQEVNELPFGLAAFFFSQNIQRCVRMYEGMEYGIVGVNDALPGAVQVPFGGVKQSGYGKEGGRSGLEEFYTNKVVSIQL